jgi:amino acid transporter
MQSGLELAFSYAVICVFAGITVLFNVGLTYGGTISLVWGWLIVGFFTLCIGASMAEVWKCSFRTL